jgi:hypothetical protein
VSRWKGDIKRSLVQDPADGREKKVAPADRDRVSTPADALSSADLAERPAEADRVLRCLGKKASNAHCTRDCRGRVSAGSTLCASSEAQMEAFMFRLDGSAEPCLIQWSADG